MQKYSSYFDFETKNEEQMKVVRAAAAMLKAPDLLGNELGLIIPEAQKLEHFFLRVANTCTDLLFGVSASMLDAEAKVNSVEGRLYPLMAGGATDKNRAVACHEEYIAAVNVRNELVDLKKYLEMKREDCVSSHYYYKKLSGESRS